MRRTFPVVAVALLGALTARAAEPEVVRLELRSSPAAEVQIDGVVVGHTPLVHRMARQARSVEVVFRRDDRPPVTRYVAANQDQKLQVVLPKPGPPLPPLLPP